MCGCNMNIEEAISQTGYGRFHWSLAGGCALALLSVGFQNGLTAYVLPVAKCELHLSSAEMGYVNVAFLVGGIGSALLWGLLGDAFGRRSVLVITLIADWLASIGAALSQSFIILVMFRLLNGFLIGGPGALVYSYLGEFQPRQYRARVLCYVGLFFSVAWLLLPGIAWIIIPLPWEIRYSGFVFNSWRFFIIVLSLPSLIGGVWIFSLPESPKYLLSRGDKKRVLAILRQMFITNNGHSPEPSQQICRLKSEVDISSLRVADRFRIIRLLYISCEQIHGLFQQPLLNITILSSSIMFANVFGYLGLGLWLPEILARLVDENENVNENVNASSILCDLYTYSNISTDYKCTENNEGIQVHVFINTIIMGTFCVAINIVGAHLIGIVEGRVVPAFTLIVGGFSAAAVYWMKTSTQILIVGSIFQASMATANIALNTLVVELFPTCASAKAVCIVTLAGRLGAVLSNLVTGLLLDRACGVPVFVAAAVSLVGGVLALRIPAAPTLGEPTRTCTSPKHSTQSTSHISVISTM